MEFSEQKEPLRLNGFSKQDENLGIGYVFPPKGTTVEDWYNSFRKNIIDALNNKYYYPVFRLSDGEFVFVLGRKFKKQLNLIYFKNLISHTINIIRFQSGFYSSGRKGYCETYKWYRLPGLRKQFANQLKDIASYGCLCFNFSETDLSREYKVNYWKWIQKNKIEISEKNYFHFYFVYGALMGTDSEPFYKGKKILLMTSNMPERNKNLINKLHSLGAMEVEYYETSLNHPMYDKINLEKIKMKPDIVLIGAGVGSANILVQLKPLNCLCIDAGYVVDAFSDIELAKKRPFCINDTIWDQAYSKK
jgi:hypothetical protein